MTRSADYVTSGVTALFIMEKQVFGVFSTKYLTNLLRLVSRSSCYSSSAGRTSITVDTREFSFFTGFFLQARILIQIGLQFLKCNPLNIFNSIERSPCSEANSSSAS